MMNKKLLFLLLIWLFGGIVGCSFVGSDPVHTIYVDGGIVSESGRFDDVADLLEAAQIVLHEYDTVSPSLETLLDEEGISVSIERGQEILLDADGLQTVLHTQVDTLGDLFMELGVQLGRNDLLWADGELVTQGTDLQQLPVPEKIKLNRFFSIQLYDGRRWLQIETNRETVAELLIEAGVYLFDADLVEPELTAEIGRDTETVVIRRANPYIIDADGQQIAVRSQATRVRDILTEAGFYLSPYDQTEPDLDAEIPVNSYIRLVRMMEQLIEEEELIAYQSSWQPSAYLELDTKGVVQAGEPGILKRQIRVQYQNGVEIGREVVAEWVEKEPVMEIKGYGTTPNIRQKSTPHGTIEYWRVVRMRVTSYTAASSGKAPDHPYYGMTYTGMEAGTGIVAVDPKIISLLSQVYVPGYGIGIAGDTGGGIKGRWIDLGYDEDEFIPWSGYIDVYYLTPVPDAAKINYLLPTWLP